MNKPAPPPKGRFYATDSHGKLCSCRECDPGGYLRERREDRSIDNALNAERHAQIKAEFKMRRAVIEECAQVLERSDIRLITDAIDLLRAMPDPPMPDYSKSDALLAEIQQEHRDRREAGWCMARSGDHWCCLKDLHEGQHKL
jgi:hypothetical protein